MKIIDIHPAIKARVNDILRTERSWQRGCRIMHANYRMATAVNAEEHYLWSLVLAANTSETNKGGEHASRLHV